MKIIPDDVLKEYECDSFREIGKVNGRPVFELYGSKNNFEQGEYTGFPVIIAKDGSKYECLTGNEFLEALKLLKRS